MKATYDHFDHNNVENLESLFYKFDEVRQLLNISKTSLYDLIKKDPKFPKPTKYIDSMQGGTYFVKEEFLAWYRNKISRD